MMNKYSSGQSECGNVLWFILIAVVLLGALTYILTRSGSSVEQSGNVEQDTIKASQIMRYGKSMETAIEQLRLNGCSENEINFEATQAAFYANPKAPSTDACDVFSVQGAGLAWQEFGSGTLSSILGTPKNILFASDVGFAGIGETQRAELALYVSVTPGVCAQINKLLDVASDDLAADFEQFEHAFVGDYPSPPNYILGDASEEGATSLEGKKSGCFQYDTVSNTDVFYHILIAR